MLYNKYENVVSSTRERRSNSQLQCDHDHDDPYIEVYVPRQDNGEGMLYNKYEIQINALCCVILLISFEYCTL
jgi:hypothetical protein